MSTFRRIAGSSIVAAAILLIAPRLASAQDTDTAEVQRYVLTEAALGKYSRATESLAALGGACEDEGSESPSIDEMVAALDAMSGAKEAVQSAGMTLREYVVFSMSLLQNGLAAWAASQQGGQLPAGVSKANVDFVTKHDPELKRLSELESAASCGDEDDAAE